MRLDQYLVKFGYFQSRQKAKYAIEDGCVLINDKVINKVSYNIDEFDSIKINAREEHYVSRGGFKLSKALKCFKIDVLNKICLDIGQSTGGFTDCLLQNGASKIYGIEVGFNQLDHSLLEDNRIITLEKTNFKDLIPKNVNNTMFDIVCIDVSFIKLTKILLNISNFIKNDTKIICLIKPQFELYEQAIKHKGYISKKEDHILAINNLINDAKKIKLYPINLTFSPITGEKKENIEFLIELSQINFDSNINVENIVEEAHKVLLS